MKGEVLVAAADIGIADCGKLDIELSIRATSRDRWLPEELVPLPVASVLVVPRQVLFWDQEPEKPNSLKRFGYMLGLRAVPRALCEEPDSQYLLEKNRGDLTVFMERYLGGEGYKSGPNSQYRARTKAVFRYHAPTDGGILSLMQRCLMESM